MKRPQPVSSFCCHWNGLRAFITNNSANIKILRALCLKEICLPYLSQKKYCGYFIWFQKLKLIHKYLSTSWLTLRFTCQERKLETLINGMRGNQNWFAFTWGDLLSTLHMLTSHLGFNFYPSGGNARQIEWVLWAYLTL